MTTTDRLVQTIRQNPEGLLLLGAGVALMLRTSATSSTAAPMRKTQRHRQETYEDKADGLKNTVGAAVDDVRGYVAEAAQGVSDKVSEFSDKASEYGHAAAERTRQAASSTRHSVEGVVESHPIAVALAGLAVGCLAAAVFPSSRLERETLAPLGRKAAAAASEVGERVKDATMKAGERLQEAASERGLTKEGLTDVARDVATGFKNNVIGSDGGSNGAPPKALS